MELALNVQKPQLYGIIAGIIVFCLTILTVLILLVKSGTMAGFLDQMKKEHQDSLKSREGEGGDRTKGNDMGEQGEDELPELYDDLIEASQKLPLAPEVPQLRGHTIGCRGLRKSDYEELTKISNGSAQFHESAYEPWNIWRYLIFKSRASAVSADDEEEVVSNKKNGGAFEVTADFLESCYQSSSPAQDSCHIVIIDHELDRPIGMMSLVDNSPRNLTVRLDNLWITPAFQSRNIGSASSSMDIKSLLSGPHRRIAKETLYTLLMWLFESCKYRRVVMEVDSKHAVMKKFADDCGFMCEGTLRKHRVVRKRSRDIQVYSMLNSDWKLGAKEALRLRSSIPKMQAVPAKDDKKDKKV